MLAAALVGVGSLVVLLVGGFVAFALRSSRLSSFNKSSRVFRLLYALFGTRLGQHYHDWKLRTFLEKNGRPHTEPDDTGMDFSGAFRVVQVPVGEDNVAYLIVDVTTGATAAVDPADAGVVCATLDRLSLQLSMVINTHHHWDHSGGNRELLRRFPGIPVMASQLDRVPHANRVLGHGEVFELGARTRITALLTPCHTAGHMCFHVVPTSAVGDCSLGAGAIFTGDALFIGGVGKFFEGGASNMLRVLEQMVALPPATCVFPGHEYTVSNLTFACLVEPTNQPARSRLQWAAERRAARQSTIPSTLLEERRYNPWIRTLTHDHLCARLGCPGDPCRAAAILRFAKDQNVRCLDETALARLAPEIDA